MTRPVGKLVAADRVDAQRRLLIAEEFLAAALDSVEADRLLAAAASATDAGIAAADALAILGGGHYYKGPDHRRAVDHLRRSGAEAANTLGRLLGLRDEAHYGTALISVNKAKRACTQARRLVDRARSAYER